MFHVPSHITEQAVQQWARCKWYVIGLEQQLQSAQAAASRMLQAAVGDAPVCNVLVRRTSGTNLVAVAAVAHDAALNQVFALHVADGAGLPPSFTWREVMGLCSFFGDVRNVTRMRSDIKSSDGTNNTGAAAEAGVASSPDQARQGQPSFVNMDSAEAAGRAVAALNGHTVQGHKLVAGLAPRKKAKVGAGKQQDNAEQTPST